MKDENVAEVLIGLGLSSLEANIYLSLIKCEETSATVKTVSDMAGVVRQDTYRVLSNLHDRGLVEKIISNPIRYSAHDFESVVSHLLKVKTYEHNVLKKKSILLMEKYKPVKNSRKTDELENIHFSVTANLELLLDKLNYEISQVESTIKMIYSKDRLSVIVYHLLDDLRAALDRGVNVRIITSKIAAGEFEKNLRNLRKTDAIYENLQVRYIEKTPGVGLALFDEKKCYIRTADSLGHSLFSINDNIINLASYFYDAIWEKAIRDTAIE